MSPDKVTKYFRDLGFRVLVRHECNANPTNEVGNDWKYHTYARIVREDGDLVVDAHAYCHPNDNPVRRVGRAKALGRCMAKFRAQFGQIAA